MFDFDPGVVRADLEQRGYVHSRGVLKQDAIDNLICFLKMTSQDCIDEHDRWQINGKVWQFLLDFPDSEITEHLCSEMAALTGVEYDALTISDRHLKVCDHDAQPWPAPDKDRAASQISIRLPVSVPDNMSAFLCLGLQSGQHLEECAVFLTDRDHPRLDKIYQHEEFLMRHRRPGVLVVFGGDGNLP